MTEPYALAHPALDHIEKTLADSYRKEIDQEENIWRSLPFFAATLALQLAALFQVIERLPSDQNWAFVPSRLLAATSFGCSLGALALLTASIWKAKFRYVARDDDLLGYALGLIEDERTAPAGLVGAVHVLKEDLARQYATATDHNRAINKRREARRSDAGLLTILSVISTLLLVSITFALYVPERGSERTGRGPEPSPAEPPRIVQPAVQGRAPAAAAPADAGGDQGVVHDARGAQDRRAVPQGRP